MYRSYLPTVPSRDFSKRSGTDRAAGQPRCRSPVPRRWSGNSRSGTTGYAAYPNTCLTSRQVQRFPRPLWRVPHPSVSRISSPGPAVFQRTICFLWHRKARVHSSRKSRCRRRGSSQPKSGKTGRCRRLPLSCLFAGIPAAFPPFRSPQRGC